MTNYVSSLGTCPYDEVPTPAGKWPTREREECAAFIRQLRRVVGQEPEGARLVIKREPGGNGGYLDVQCAWEDGNDAAREYAFKSDRSVPARWDLFALVELTAGRIPFDGACRSTYSPVCS